MMKYLSEEILIKALRESVLVIHEGHQKNTKENYYNNK